MTESIIEQIEASRIRESAEKLDFQEVFKWLNRSEREKPFFFTNSEVETVVQEAKADVLTTCGLEESDMERLRDLKVMVLSPRDWYLFHQQFFPEIPLTKIIKLHAYSFIPLAPGKENIPFFVIRENPLVLDGERRLDRKGVIKSLIGHTLAKAIRHELMETLMIGKGMARPFQDGFIEFVNSRIDREKGVLPFEPGYIPSYLFWQYFAEALKGEGLSVNEMIKALSQHSFTTPPLNRFLDPLVKRWGKSSFTAIFQEVTNIAGKASVEKALDKIMKLELGTQEKEVGPKETLSKEKSSQEREERLFQDLQKGVELAEKLLEEDPENEILIRQAGETYRAFADFQEERAEGRIRHAKKLVAEGRVKEARALLHQVGEMECLRDRPKSEAEEILSQLETKGGK